MNTPTTQPLVSIITPAFNAAPFILETIQSAQTQTYANWEMLIADDGSTDNTVSIVRREAQADPRIRLIPLAGEPGLAARARNRAMAEATGAYFALLDADDLWEPDKLKRQIAFLEDHPEADGVCCWFDCFGDAERVRREVFRMKTAPVCQRADLIDGIPFFTLTLVFRKGCYEALGGMDEDPRLASLEDAEYFARLVTQFQIHRLRVILAHYRMSSLANPSLGLSTVTDDNATGWILTEVYERKGILNPEELKRRKAFLHYQRARTNLFLFRKPFRRYLWKCVATGSPPWQALLMLGLSFLPGPILAALLSQGQRWANRRKRRRHAE